MESGLRTRRAISCGCDSNLANDDLVFRRIDRGIDYDKHIPTLDKNSQQGIDIERFRWFSQDYLGYDYQSQLVADIRYSMIPSQIKPMWGLRINPAKNQREHAVWMSVAI